MPFLKSDYWRLRGGLDVPKERCVSYPGCERGADGSFVIAWAGWDHLQQATALAAYYLDMKDNEGWDRCRAMLLGIGVAHRRATLNQVRAELREPLRFQPDFLADLVPDTLQVAVTDAVHCEQLTRVVNSHVRSVPFAVRHFLSLLALPARDYPSLIPPEILKPIRRKLRVAHGMLDILVTEIMLYRPRVVSIVGELKAAGVAQHVGVNGEA